MYINHIIYTKLGYTVVPKLEFGRYNVMAEATVRRYTQNRIQSMFPPEDADDETRRICELNRRGLCEIIDAYYLGNNPQSEAAKARQVITGFSNGKYSQTHLGEARSDAGLAAPERLGIREIMTVYFTPDQIYRGVG